MTSLIKVILFIVIFSFAGYAQISITSTNFSYTQDFNSLSYLYGPHAWTNNTSILGWHLYIEEAILQYYGDNGTSNGNSIKSYGTLSSTDRSIGSVSTGNMYWGVQFTNNSGATLAQIPVEYTGEQWRAANRPAQYLDFAYSLNATSLDDINGDWTTIGSMRFISPVVSQNPEIALDGNSLLNSGLRSTTLNISLLPGQSIWFRWQRNSVLAAWHGLGIDDFKFNPNGSTLPVELSSLSAFAIGNTVKLNWTTETEVNNYGFEVERTSPIPSPYQGEGSEAGRGWEMIGFVTGNGNSNSSKNYSFEDNNIPGNANTLHYRLKQIDNDGQFEYSKIVEVSFFKPVDFSLKQNYPNPFNPSTLIQYHLPEDGLVRLSVYNLLGQEIMILVNEFKEAGIHSYNFNSTHLNSGVYLYKLDSKKFTEVKKMMILK